MSDGSLLREMKRALRSVIPAPILEWREIQYYSRHGEVELHLLPYLCDSQRDSIDIGANDGCYVQFLRRYSRRVIAFEPLPDLAAHLRRRFGEEVIIHNIALSDGAGTAMLRTPLLKDVLVTGCSSMAPQAVREYPAYREIEVEVAALDELYEGDVGFIKIDVEGHEESVLDGAQATIARCRPKMLIEIDERLSPGGVKRVASFFKPLGYNGFFVYRRDLLSVEQFDATIMQRRENLPNLEGLLEDRERFGPYLLNFLFLPEECLSGVLQDVKAQLARL